MDNIQAILKKRRNKEMSEKQPNIAERSQAFLQEYGMTIREQLKEEITKRFAETSTELSKMLTSTEIPGNMVYQRDIETAVRKIILLSSPSGKKTLTETTDKPSEGGDVTKKVDVEAAFQKMKREHGAV